MKKLYLAIDTEENDFVIIADRYGLLEYIATDYCLDPDDGEDYDKICDIVGYYDIIPYYAEDAKIISAVETNKYYKVDKLANKVFLSIDDI